MNKNTPEKIEKILVIVAHADDEAIGCGGTLMNDLAPWLFALAQICYAKRGILIS